MTTKADYIEKYGEEAYKKQLERVKAWQAAHREEQKEYNKAWYVEHREEILEKQEAYRAAHREEKKEHDKAYREAHREEKKEHDKAYREAHREERKAYDAARFSTPQGRAQHLLYGYRQMDRERNLGETTITADWIQEHIFSSSCTYCGETDWTKLGTDRIDNTKAHTPDNCICACAKCNTERGNRYSVEDFTILKRETLSQG